MTRLIIVRHAETEHNCLNKIQGHGDSCLSPRGLRQARRLGLRLKKVHFDQIYSSDLGRAWATTQAITKHKKTLVTRDPLLREILLGDWEGMTPEEVDELYDKGYQKWLKKPSACVIPKAENVAHFRRRITERVQQIARQNRGKTVLIVTHGGAITALLADWLGADFDHLLLNLTINNTSLTVVDHTDARTRLHQINDVAHLSPEELGR